MRGVITSSVYTLIFYDAILELQVSIKIRCYIYNDTDNYQSKVFYHGFEKIAVMLYTTAKNLLLDERNNGTLTNLFWNSDSKRITIIVRTTRV